jgi:hypothetical protein
VSAVFQGCNFPAVAYTVLLSKQHCCCHVQTQFYSSCTPSALRAEPSTPACITPAVPIAGCLSCSSSCADSGSVRQAGSSRRP